MMDTDEEVTGGRVTLLNGNGPPYFHGYLYMKGECFLFFFFFSIFHHSGRSLNCSSRHVTATCSGCSRSDDPVEEALVRVEGRDLHVVPVQTGVAQVGLAVQEGRRPLHSVTEVVVVVTGS